MNIVGERFEECEYYLSELIYAADIFKKAGAPLQEELKNSVQRSYGTLVLGTVKNDIHDFGKDIVATVMSSNGIKVIDLGVNVEHQAFVDAIKEHERHAGGHELPAHHRLRRHEGRHRRPSRTPAFATR